jgi:hypothetical protein
MRIGLNAGGSPLLMNDDEESWAGHYAKMEREYARLTDPGYETPAFNFDSD